MKSLCFFLIFVLLLTRFNCLKKGNTNSLVNSTKVYSPFIYNQSSTQNKFKFFYDYSQSEMMEYAIMDFLFVRNSTSSDYEDMTVCKPYYPSSTCDEEQVNKIKQFKIFSESKYKKESGCADLLNNLLCIAKCNRGDFTSNKIIKQDKSGLINLNISHSTCFNLFRTCNSTDEDYIDFCEKELNLPGVKLKVGNETFIIFYNSSVTNNNLQSAFVYAMRNFNQIFDSNNNLKDQIVIQNLLDGSVEKHLHELISIIYPNYQFLEEKIKIQTLKVLSYCVKWIKFLKHVYQEVNYINFNHLKIVRIFSFFLFKIGDFLSNFENDSPADFKLSTIKNFYLKSSEIKNLLLVAINESNDDLFLNLENSNYGVILQIFLNKFYSFLGPELRNEILTKFVNLKTELQTFISRKHNLMKKQELNTKNEIISISKLHIYNQTVHLNKTSSEELDNKKEGNIKLTNLTFNLNSKLLNEKEIYKELNTTLTIDYDKTNITSSNYTKLKLSNKIINSQINNLNLSNLIHPLPNNTSHSNFNNNSSKIIRRPFSHMNETLTINNTLAQIANQPEPYPKHMQKTITSPSSDSNKEQEKEKFKTNPNLTFYPSINSNLNSTRFLTPLKLPDDIFNRTSFDLITYNVAQVGEIILFYLLVIILTIIYCVLIKVLLNKCHDYFTAYNYKMNPDNYTTLFTFLAVFLLVCVVIGILLYSNILVILLFAIDSELLTGSFIFHHQHGKVFGPLGFSFFAFLVGCKVFNSFNLYTQIILVSSSTLAFFYIGVYVGLHKFIDYEKLQPVEKPKHSANKNEENSLVK